MSVLGGFTGFNNRHLIRQSPLFFSLDPRTKDLEISTEDDSNTQVVHDLATGWEVVITFDKDEFGNPISQP